VFKGERPREGGKMIVGGEIMTVKSVSAIPSSVDRYKVGVVRDAFEIAKAITREDRRRKRGGV